jgi:hypothetical protein
MKGEPLAEIVELAWLLLLPSTPDARIGKTR